MGREAAVSANSGKVQPIPHDFLHLFIYLFIVTMDHFIIFIDFVTILVLFYVLVFWPRDMWDLSSLTTDETHTPCIGRWNLNHWTAREVP